MTRRVEEVKATVAVEVEGVVAAQLQTFAL